MFHAVNMYINKETNLHAVVNLFSPVFSEL